MLTIKAQNIAQQGNVADYAVRVEVNGVVITTLTVTSHDRADGWRQLLRLIADAPETCADVRYDKRGMRCE